MTWLFSGHSMTLWDHPLLPLARPVNRSERQNPNYIPVSMQFFRDWASKCWERKSKQLDYVWPRVQAS